MKQDTKYKILEAGAEIVHRKGFNHTGIKEILDAAQVPKGSFYFYFKNKEDFGLHLIDYFEEYFSNIIKDIFNDSSLSPLEKIRTLLSTSKEHFKSMDYCCGCPIGNLAQEMGDLSPAFQARLKKSVDSMADYYREILLQAREAGEISEKLDIKEASHFIVFAWHGALTHMKIAKSAEPLEIQERFIFDYILKP
ncbi:MAG: TetR family transcriptional regulator [Desulfobacterales bacterium]|nr:TetR family transcriptional regulator [Desulfobacterales bacterium]